MVVFSVLYVISADDLDLAYVGILLPLLKGGGQGVVSDGLRRARTARKSTFLRSFCS